MLELTNVTFYLQGKIIIIIDTIIIRRFTLAKISEKTHRQKYHSTEWLPAHIRYQFKILFKQ